MNTRSSVPDGAGDTASTVDQVRRFGPPAILGLVATLFVFQNTESVAFNFLWFDFNAPLWLMLVVFAVVGAIVFMGLQRRRRRRKAAD
jgi:uncharacterized integral membrane protein